MSQPQQQPKVVSPQSATTTASAATVCHLVAGGAIVKIWVLLQMQQTTQAQNRQLVLMCVLALITLTTGATLLHVLITNYKCWVAHAYAIAVQETPPAPPLTPSATAEEPSQKPQQPPAQQTELPKDQPEQPKPAEPQAEDQSQTRQRRRWRF